MKITKILVLILALSIAFSPIYTYAKPLNVNTILKDLTNTKLTSIQRRDAVRQYNGQVAVGKGRVKDVLQVAGTKNDAVVYLTKRFKGETYELVLTIGLETAKSIRKGKTIQFEGMFDGTSFNALRFKNVEIIRGKILGIF
ncbi:MAG: hypothetical protein HQ549_06705 [Candidatus Omnitrophica bacterium]|nr:hypothetical protein [Candidatus Omnitrophota bacterium]